MALERLNYDRTPKAVTHRFDKADGTTAGTKTVDPLEFLARLRVHISRQRPCDDSALRLVRQPFLGDAVQGGGRSGAARATREPHAGPWSRHRRGLQRAGARHAPHACPPPPRPPLEYAPPPALTGAAIAPSVRRILDRPRLKFLAFAMAAITLLVPLGAHAQDGYRQPPEPIRSILDATLTPRVAVSPDKTRLLLLNRPDGQTDHGVDHGGRVLDPFCMRSSMGEQSPRIDQGL